MNPETTTVNVGDTPTLVFSGTGKFVLNNLGPTVRYGGPAVDFYDTATHLPSVLTGSGELCAPGEIYGICAAATTSVVRVTRWF